MFRVLSEEESRKVTRWRAPEIDSNTAVIAKTRQESSPEQPHKDSSVQALQGGLDLKPGHLRTASSASRSRSLNSADVPIFSSNLQRSAGDIPKSSDLTAPVSAELLQSSYDEGFSRGFAQGKAALQNASVKELETIVLALTKASERAKNSDLEQELVAMVVDIARLVIRREVSLEPEIMHAVVTAGLEQVAASSASQCVYLHPVDANIVREQLPADVVVRVLDDPSLARGGCRIESGSSEVSAGIEDWLSSVSLQLGLVPEKVEMPAEDSTIG